MRRPGSDEANSFNDEYDYTQNRMTRNPVINRPIPNYLEPRSHSESWCSSFHMKVRFHSHAK